MALDKCCACYNSDDALVYQSKVALSKLSSDIDKSKRYGFSCDKNAEKKVDVLTKYLSILEDEARKRALGGKPCLNCVNYQTLSEKVRVLSASCDMMSRKDIVVDSSAEESWLIQNPFCVSREKWERLSKMVCAAFKLELKVDGVGVDDKMCDFTFEISRETITCDLMVAISVYLEMCDLDLKVTRSEEECLIDFEILVAETKSCDIDFKMYKTLIDCNLSFDIIKAAVDSGCTFNIGDPITLSTPLGNTYSLSDLRITGTPDVNMLKKLGVNLENSNFIKNPNKFIKKIKKDYGGK